MSLLKAYNSTLEHTEGKCALPELHVNISEGENTAQLRGLFTEDELRETLKEKKYYAVDMSVPFTAFFIVRSLGF